jgi:2-dehydro-3-deoxyphosphooctonate aldolase (KDO 8-P synthase)
MPGMGKGTTSGDRTMVNPLARGAAAVGVDGFFFETHFDPDNALSDGPNMLKIPDLYILVDQILRIKEAV